MTPGHGDEFGIPRLVSHDTVVLGVPAYNEARFIEATLESIRAQNHRNFSVLISDNASTDDTERIARRFAEQDPRFTYLRQPGNIGAARNFDFVRHATSSPYFAWVGGHDLLHPDYLSVQLRALEDDPAIGAAFSYFDIIDQFGRTIELESDSGAAAPRSGRFFRYLWSAALGAEFGAIHGLFRRSCMSPIPIHTCPVSDLVFLSNSLYLAPFHSVPGHLYRLRSFHDRARPNLQVERLTGKPDVPVLDFRQTIACFLEDFDRIVPAGSWQRRMKPLVRWSLRDRFLRPPLLLRPFRITKLLRSLVKRGRDLRRLFAPAAASSPARSR